MYKQKMKTNNQNKNQQNTYTQQQQQKQDRSSDPRFWGHRVKAKVSRRSSIDAFWKC